MIIKKNITEEIDRMRELVFLSESIGEEINDDDYIMLWKDYDSTVSCGGHRSIAELLSLLTEKGYYLDHIKKIQHNGCKLKMCIFSHSDSNKLPPRAPIPFAFGDVVSGHCFLVKKKKCWNCGSFSANVKKCSGCTFAYFCNRRCQRLGWRLHKANCKKPETIAGSTP